MMNPVSLTALALLAFLLSACGGIPTVNISTSRGAIEVDAAEMESCTTGKVIAQQIGHTRFLNYPGRSCAHIAVEITQRDGNIDKVFARLPASTADRELATKYWSMACKYSIDEMNTRFALDNDRRDLIERTHRSCANLWMRYLTDNSFPARYREQAKSSAITYVTYSSREPALGWLKDEGLYAIRLYAQSVGANTLLIADWLRDRCEAGADRQACSLARERGIRIDERKFAEVAAVLEEVRAAADEESRQRRAEERQERLDEAQRRRQDQAELADALARASANVATATGRYQAQAAANLRATQQPLSQATAPRARQDGSTQTDARGGINANPSSGGDRAAPVDCVSASAVFRKPPNDTELKITFVNHCAQSVKLTWCSEKRSGGWLKEGATVAPGQSYETPEFNATGRYKFWSCEDSYKLCGGACPP